MLLEGGSKRERDADTCHRDKVVPTAVADSRQRVHLGVHADDASTRRAALELCAPGGREAEVIPSHRETARGHEVGQEVMCVSARGEVSAVARRINGSVVKWGKLEMCKQTSPRN